MLRDLLQHCMFNKITIHYLHRKLKLQDTGSLNPLLILDFQQNPSSSLWHVAHRPLCGLKLASLNSSLVQPVRSTCGKCTAKRGSFFLVSLMTNLSIYYGNHRRILDRPNERKKRKRQLVSRPMTKRRVERLEVKNCS